MKSEEEAEDAVQYLFMKLWEQRETFSFESGIRSLLFTILKNYILNELRHRNLVFEKLYEMAQQVNDEDEDAFLTRLNMVNSENPCGLPLTNFLLRNKKSAC